MSKQSFRRKVARDRQLQAEQTGRFRGFVATLHEPGREPRVLARKQSSPPPEARCEFPYRFSTSSDPLLSWSGAPSIEALEQMLDEQAADLGHQADDRLGGWESRTVIVPPVAIDLGTTPLA